MRGSPCAAAESLHTPGEQRSECCPGWACSGTLGLRNKPGAKEQRELPAASPAVPGPVPAGHLCRDVSQQAQARNKVLRHFASTSQLAVPPLATTAGALEGRASSARCPHEHAKHRPRPRGSVEETAAPGAQGAAHRGLPRPAEESSMPGAVVSARLRPGAARRSQARVSASSGRLLLLPSGNAAAPHSARPRAPRGRWGPECSGGRGARPRRSGKQRCAAGAPPGSLPAGTARARLEAGMGCPSRRRVQHPATRPLPAGQPKC